MNGVTGAAAPFLLSKGLLLRSRIASGLGSVSAALHHPGALQDHQGSAVDEQTGWHQGATPPLLCIPDVSPPLLNHVDNRRSVLMLQMFPLQIKQLYSSVPALS